VNFRVSDVCGKAVSQSGHVSHVTQRSHAISSYPFRLSCFVIKHTRQTPIHFV